MSDKKDCRCPRCKPKTFFLQLIPHMAFGVMFYFGLFSAVFAYLSSELYKGNLYMLMVLFAHVAGKFSRPDWFKDIAAQLKAKTEEE